MTRDYARLSKSEPRRRWNVPGRGPSPREGLDMSNGNSIESTMTTVRELLELRATGLAGSEVGALESMTAHSYALGVSQVISVVVEAIALEELAGEHAARRDSLLATDDDGP